MNQFSQLFTLILLLCSTGLLKAQAPGFEAAVDGAFGMDQELVNGSQYYNRHLQAAGHPYFMENSYRNASVSIRGRLFDDVSLKYDVYYQQVLLEYTSFSGAPNQVILVNEHLDYFTLGNYLFEQREGMQGLSFYQKIETSSFTCYVHWRKRLDPVKQQANITEQFSAERRSFSILVDGEELSLSNKKRFLSCFDPLMQKDLKRVLRERHFSFRRSSPGVIVRTMHELDAVVQKGGGA